MLVIHRLIVFPLVHKVEYRKMSNSFWKMNQRITFMGVNLDISSWFMVPKFVVVQYRLLMTLPQISWLWPKTVTMNQYPHKHDCWQIKNASGKCRLHMQRCYKTKSKFNRGEPRKVSFVQLSTDPHTQLEFLLLQWIRDLSLENWKI